MEQQETLQILDEGFVSDDLKRWIGVQLVREKIEHYPTKEVILVLRRNALPAELELDCPSLVQVELMRFSPNQWQIELPKACYREIAQ